LNFGYVETVLLIVALVAFDVLLLIGIELLLRKQAGRRSITRPLRKVGLLIAGTLAVFLLPLTCIELLLRRWAGMPIFKLNRIRRNFVHHQDCAKGSWGLPYEIAATRDLEISKTHWHEMKSGLNLRELTSRWSPTSSGPILNRISGSFSGTEFSYSGGERTTTNSPIEDSSQILCLGGSTTFCMEVADSRTWPSVLQQLVNFGNRGAGFRVRNLGVPGTPGIERILTLRYAENLSEGDIAVFLFGDNDSGWVQYGRREGIVHAHLPLLLRKLLTAAEFFEIANWLYGEIAPRFLNRLAVEMAETTIAAAEEVAQFAKERGAKVLFVLQPNLFTLARPDAWDAHLISGTARDLKLMLDGAYQRYQRWIAVCDFAVDATSLFDSETPSPYIGDWTHVNTRGNQLLGEFVFRELESRSWLSTPTRLNSQ